MGFSGILNFDNFIALLDIFIVAALFYWLMLFIRGTRAAKMVWGIGVIVVLYFASQRAGLVTLHWILDYFLSSIIIIIIVVFQQDIRRGLVHMGRPFSSRGMIMGAEFLDEISGAVSSMSSTRTGALIAIEREANLAEVAEAGVEIDAVVSRELLVSVFNTDSPMHDGSVIIKRDRVSRAGAILPLTGRELDKSMGTRHRAAIGLSEETDGVVIVVSEKTGEVSIAMGGVLETDFDRESLRYKLKDIFESEEGARRGLFSKVGWH